MHVRFYPACTEVILVVLVYLVVECGEEEGLGL